MSLENIQKVSIDDIIAEILPFTDDENLKKGYTKGWYISGIQKAMDKLAFTLFYDEQTVDEPLVGYQHNVPCNIFNVTQVYLFNGTCSPQTSVKVYWKRQFNNGKGGTNYTSSSNGNYNQIDPYQPNFFVGSNVYYAGMQNGKLMLSANASGYGFIRIVGNGLPTDIGLPPSVPREFRDFVVDYGVWRFFLAQSGKEQAAIRNVKLWYDKIYDRATGTYYEAKKAANRLGTWKNDSLNESLYGKLEWGNGYGW